MMQAALSMHLEKGIDCLFLALYLGAFQSTGKLTTPMSFCLVSLTANSFRLQMTNSPVSRVEFEVMVLSADEMLDADAFGSVG